MTDSPVSETEFGSSGLPEIDAAAAAFAVDDLRRARRHRRIGDVAWGDLAYRVYTTTLACIVFAIFASGWVGDSEVSKAGIDEVLRLGPAWAGLAAAIAAVLGIRSGSRGGPLALEGADVYHLLLAPVDRSRVLRRPAVGVIGYGMAGGAAAGGLGGALASQRLPGNNAEWMLSGAVFGGTVAGIALGSALLTASRRIDRRIMIVVSLACVAWSVASVTEVTEANRYTDLAPFSAVGGILFWPLRFRPVDFVAVAAAIVLSILGVLWIGGLSAEAAQRRTRLVGQLRFAVTQQDLRSVLLLRRQLSSERPRNRSRLRRVPMSVGARFPVFTRDVHSIARWPFVRIARVGILGIAAGLACRGVWSGTTPLILVAGIAYYIAALDAIEPMAQEIDHPMMVTSYPLPAGVVLQRHLAAPILVMLTTSLLGGAVAWAFEPSGTAAAVILITAISASLAGVGGAAVSVASEAILDQSDAAMMPPEVAGPRVVFRMAWPPIVAIVGFIPVLGAQRAMRDHGDLIAATVPLAAVAVALSAIVFLWVRYREEMHRSMNEALGGK